MIFQLPFRSFLLRFFPIYLSFFSFLSFLGTDDGRAHKHGGGLGLEQLHVARGQPRAARHLRVGQHQQLAHGPDARCSGGAWVK